MRIYTYIPILLIVDCA